MTSSEDEMLTIEQMQARIVQRASDDADYRSKFKADPKSVISEEFGIELPDEFQIEVHENSVDTVHVALPPHPALSDEDLERAFGGFSKNLP